MMRKQRLLIASGLVVIVLLLAGAFALAQPEQGTPATLLVLEGQAEVIQKGALGLNNSAATVSAGQAMAVRAGDKINLGLSGSARLRLADGSVVDLFEYTSLEITELLTTEKSYRVRLTLLTGRTLSSVSRALGIGDTFEIRTPSSTASVRGTVFRVDVVTPQWTYVACDRGVVRVTMGEQFVDLRAGEEVDAIVGRPLLVQPQNAATEPLAPTIEALLEPEPEVEVADDAEEAAETAPEDAGPPPISDTAVEPTALPLAAPAEDNAASPTAPIPPTEVLPVQPPPVDPPPVNPPPIQPPPVNPPPVDPPPANPPPANPPPANPPPANPPPANPPNPNPPPQVPGNPPGDTPGNPPGGGGVPPGQGGVPPGQIKKP